MEKYFNLAPGSYKASQRKRKRRRSGTNNRQVNRPSCALFATTHRIHLVLLIIGRLHLASSSGLKWIDESVDSVISWAVPDRKWTTQVLSTQELGLEVRLVQVRELAGVRSRLSLLPLGQFSSTNNSFLAKRNCRWKTRFGLPVQSTVSPLIVLVQGGSTKTGRTKKSRRRATSRPLARSKIIHQNSIMQIESMTRLEGTWWKLSHQICRKKSWKSPTKDYNRTDYYYVGDCWMT